MPEIDELRGLVDQIRPPDLDALRDTAVRRDRRARLARTAGVVAFVVAVGAGVLVVGDRDGRSLPDPVAPTPTPTPVRPDPTPGPAPAAEPAHASETSMTPREVVYAPNAQLQLTGVSADDPGFRLSLWKAECTWCPKDPRLETRPSFAALAITTDGFETAIYRRPGFAPDLPWNVFSPAPGVLLIVDDSNGIEWLVRPDGSVTRVERSDEEVLAADPRLWFGCLVDRRAAWCALDPETDTMHKWRGRWIGTSTDLASAVPPGSGAEPWGRSPSPGPDLEAWWERDGVRQRAVLAESQRRGSVRNGPVDEPLYWSSPRRSGILTLHSLGDDGTWDRSEVDAPFRSDWLTVHLTPTDALVVREAVWTDSGDFTSRIWRSEARGDGEWTLAHDSTGHVPWATRATTTSTPRARPSRSSTATCGWARSCRRTTGAPGRRSTAGADVSGRRPGVPGTTVSVATRGGARRRTPPRPCGSRRPAWRRCSRGGERPSSRSAPAPRRSGCCSCLTRPGAAPRSRVRSARPGGQPDDSRRSASSAAGVAPSSRKVARAASSSFRADSTSPTAVRARPVASRTRAPS